VEHVNEPVETELVDLAAEEVVESGLRDPEALCCLPPTHIKDGVPDL
jgi:hypothetical protein